MFILLQAVLIIFLLVLMFGIFTTVGFVLMWKYDLLPTLPKWPGWRNLWKS
jgi:hypothetical protein